VKTSGTILEYWQQSGWQAETIETSRSSAAEGRPAKAGTLSTEETPTTVLLLAGTPTATVWSPTTHDFSGEICKKLSAKQKIRKKTQKRVAVAYLSPIDFVQSDSYRIIGVQCC
jgi:hypothetical protein